MPVLTPHPHRRVIAHTPFLPRLTYAITIRANQSRKTVTPIAYLCKDGVASA